MNLSIDTSMVKNYATYQVQTDKKKEEETTEKSNFSQDEYTAVSSQGDTLQISQAGASAYENSSEEESKNSEEQTNVAKIVSDVVDTDDSDGTSSTEDLSSYTEAELKQMYQNGEISKADYDEELKSRETQE